MEPRARFGPGPIVVFPLIVTLVGTLPIASTLPALAWLPLLPVLAASWALRARIVATPRGVEVCNGLRVRRVPWHQVEGFDVPRRGFVRLLHGGRRTPLTALPRRDVRRLVAVAQELAPPAGDEQPART